MLQKWKNILINWINCYFNGENKKEQIINLDSLLRVISHLRENLSLDESKSSVLEANTIQEFILEKYPEFKFDNGTIEPTSEEEMYLVASLLLFFVCVISKDVDIKNAMCSKLSIEDQEVLLKFNKSLMECTVISCADVQNAITEACGQDMATLRGSHTIISATPPALRSLHSEVRRLQAALDAERFDRNYLQEELSRTNLKLEKLLKDKDKYKLDIVNLKSKISMCCGQEAENRALDTAGEGSQKLMRQLQQIEEKLVETQGQLDDALYERDTYKNKIDTLKQERDKWLSLSQQETTRVSQLTGELEVERRNVLSLRDLVTELRQHNQLNRFDSSQLECDDPDTSIHSLHHNSSVCSEVCANVIEVQLGEERAKIVELEQQIQTLQDQLNELNKKSEHEKKVMNSIISEKESDIINLKQRINKEIEDKHNIKNHFDDEISKLNNEMIELEQKLKDNIEQSRYVIDVKMQEIKVIQEEKLSLLISFSDETTKLDKIIKSLKAELEVERNTKMTMKAEYDNSMMKLNEKILNRNNELVELQNNIFEKSEQLEDLHSKLRNEIQLKEDLKEKNQKELEQLNEQIMQTENMLTQKTQEIKQLKLNLQDNVNYIDQLNKNVDDLNEKIFSLNEKCSLLEENKLTLLLEVKNRDKKIEELQKEIENTNNIFKEEKEKWLHDRDDIHNTINVLQLQLDNELHFKTQLQNELIHLQGIRTSLLEDNNNLNMELSKIKSEIEVKDQTISGMDLYLTDAKHEGEKLKRHNEELYDKINSLTKEVETKDVMIKEIKNKLEEEKRCYVHEINEKDELLVSEKQKLLDAQQEKNLIQADLNIAINEKVKLENDARQKLMEMSLLKEEAANLVQTIEEKNSRIEALNTKLDQETSNRITLENSVASAEEHIREDRTKFDVLNQQIHTLEEQLKEINQTHEREKQATDCLISEKESDIFNLKHRINEEIEEKNNIKAQYNDDISKLNNEINELEQKIQDTTEQTRQMMEAKVHVIAVIQEEKRSLLQSLSDETTKLDNIIKNLKAELELERSTKISMKDEYENQIMKLNEKVLNRNNELVELQNNVFERSEQLEELHAKIRHEQQIKQDLTIKYRSEIEQLTEQKMETGNLLEQKNQTIEQLQTELQESISYCDRINKEVDDMKHTISILRENYRILEDNKLTLLSEVKNRDDKAEEVQKEVENINNMYSEEKEKWLYDIAEKDHSINALQTQLQNEIHSRNQLQNELINFQEIRTSLLEDINNKKIEVLNSKKEIEEKNLTVIEMNLCIKEEKDKNETLKINLDQLNEKIKVLSEEVKAKDINLREIEAILQEQKKCHEDEINKKDEILKIEHQKLLDALDEKSAAESNFNTALNEKNTLEKEVNKKCVEILQLKEECVKLTNTIEDHRSNVSSKDCVLNEVENQLKAERAKVIEFKGQVQNLQEKINELTQANENEKLAMELIISEKESDMLNLKQLMNEEVEDKLSLRVHYDSEITKLNNTVTKLNSEINELEQKLKENTEQSRHITESNKEEIKVLQEEKQSQISQIQSLIIETTKLNDIISNLKSELDMEKSTKISMKEEYDNHIVNLNEKLSETNKELAELRDKLSEKTEQLKVLHAEKRNERQNEQDLIDKQIKELEQLNEQKMQTDNMLTQKIQDIEYLQKVMYEKESHINQLNIDIDDLNKTILNLKENCRLLEESKLQTDNMLTQKIQDIEQLNKELQEKDANANKLNRDIDDLKKTISNLKESCRILEESKLTLLLEIKNREVNVEKVQKEIENTNTKWLQDIDENNITINALQTQLQNEIFYKMKLQNELTDLQRNKDSLSEDINALKLELVELKKEIDQKDKVIVELNVNLQEKKKENEKQNLEYERMVEKVEIMSKEMKLKEVAVQQIQNMLEEEKVCYKNEIRKKDELLEFEHQKLLDALEEKSAVQADLISVIKEKVNLEKDVSQKSIELIQLKEESSKLLQSLETNKSNSGGLEDQLLDMTKELEVSKENCHQLSNQLKKIVHQKNEEIAELKKQISKMTVTENRATQIIKVSAKYQAIILKRIAEIKNNTALKELTNFGNSANCDNEVRRNLYAGTVTMEDLENFLETTERHLRRCSEKQIAMQKERDRLTEVNKINESELINIKKFLTELAVEFKTFSNIKSLYSQKLSRIVSVQRTVRREILNLDGHITDATMCKLERGYAAVMQDLSECSMNMQRWVECSIDRTISLEKMKQALSTDSGRPSLASASFQNTSLELQLEDMEKSFQKLLEEVIRAQKGEGAKDTQSVTVMEVRAEYEDKLNRMKAKMKELYHEQIAVFQNRQKEEIASLERELQKAERKLAESSRAYEEHIRVLTTELWTVGEKFLMKQDEAEWLRRKQRSGSLMSLQHVHSSGLVQPIQESSRPSDTHSLRSLPVSSSTSNKREGRGLHMSDEEGEVFDNRCLKELTSTPRRSPAPGLRLSELRWRNSLCPPHLKSSYPTETQLAATVDEDDIKCANVTNGGGRQQRKEVGITAYKKPGPPTPSKQAGRLSATDSELRESLRVEMDPQPSRKTSTPSRIRALFRSAKNDTIDGTPRKKLSIFKKK